MKSQFKAGDFVLSTQEIKIIIHSTSSFRNRTLIKALYYNGLRREEVTELDIRDIDFQRRRLTVRMGKGGKTRTIPFIDFEFMGDLKHLIGDKKEGYVFCKSNGKKLTTRMINKIVETAGKESDIQHPNPNCKHINPHLFRHSIARHLKSKGFSVEWIQNFLGHSSYKTTMDVYGRLSLDEMQQISDKRFGLVEDKSGVGE